MQQVTAANAAEAARAVRQQVAEERAGTQRACTVRRSATLAELAKALCAAQQEMPNPPKDSVNPHFKSRYADLATVRDTVLPVLNGQGLTLTQLPCELDGQPALMSLLVHVSGEWLESVALLRPTKLDPQGVGSALTYMRRYAMQSIAGVAGEDDDDGQAASQPRQERAVPAANPGLVAKFAQRFAQCKTRAEYEAARAEAVAANHEGRFAPGDWSQVRDAAGETSRRLPAAEPAKAGAS